MKFENYQQAVALGSQKVIEKLKKDIKEKFGEQVAKDYSFVQAWKNNSTIKIYFQPPVEFSTFMMEDDGKAQSIEIYITDKVQINPPSKENLFELNADQRKIASFFDPNHRISISNLTNDGVFYTYWQHGLKKNGGHLEGGIQIKHNIKTGEKTMIQHETPNPSMIGQDDVEIELTVSEGSGEANIQPVKPDPFIEWNN